jgi:hypothetical protein
VPPELDWSERSGSGIWPLDRYDLMLDRAGVGYDDPVELPPGVVDQMMFLELERSPDAVAAERERRRAARAGE